MLQRNKQVNSIILDSILFLFKRKSPSFGLHWNAAYSDCHKLQDDKKKVYGKIR